MRQWLVNPIILCNKHLLGEHVEHHMFIGTLKRNISIKGYIDNNLIQPNSLVSRHNTLCDELLRRKYIKTKKIFEHNSLIDFNEYLVLFNSLKIEYQNYIINQQSSLDDLINRCSQCLERYNIFNQLNLDNIFEYNYRPKVLTSELDTITNINDYISVFKGKGNYYV